MAVAVCRICSISFKTFPSYLGRRPSGPSSTGTNCKRKWMKRDEDDISR